MRRLESQCFSLLQTVATDKLLRSLDTFSAPIMLCDMLARGWPILHANEAWVKRLGGWARLPVHAGAVQLAYAVAASGCISALVTVVLTRESPVDIPERLQDTIANLKLCLVQQPHCVLFPLNGAPSLLPL